MDQRRRAISRTQDYWLLMISIAAIRTVHAWQRRNASLRCCPKRKGCGCMRYSGPIHAPQIALGACGRGTNHAKPKSYEAPSGTVPWPGAGFWCVGAQIGSEYASK
ncbi:hypothetical protein B0H16DRAFT_781357 [Mycena metata]|uniref:Secreted protein n=1 Tax=Mycena metata TaxID=1033252 RepID=A0AAD7IZE0_9AGAR|nr:hypothetical protein B0H16DRAFT_781357 [Mycena metata]